MGQRIQLQPPQIIADSAVFTGDRSFTGMDGVGFDTRQQAEASDRYPAKLAVRLFDGDEAISRVYVYSNDVIVTRSGGWDDASVAAVAELIEAFFLYYPG